MSRSSIRTASSFSTALASSAGVGMPSRASLSKNWGSAVTEIQEVNVKLDDSFTGHVCDFGVGFPKFEKDGPSSVLQPLLPSGSSSESDPRRRLFSWPRH